MPPPEQFAAVELWRGTITRHTVIAYEAGDQLTARLDFSAPPAEDWVPLRVPTAIAVRERLPAGAAAVLLNRAHAHTDLVRFVDDGELQIFEAIDGQRTIGALGHDAGRIVERFWRHDLVVIDASTRAGRHSTDTEGT
jgi:hypothetical protein